MLEPIDRHLQLVIIARELLHCINHLLRCEQSEEPEVITDLAESVIGRHPRRLTRSGAEYIFERIPMEIVEIQKKAREILLTCARETRRDTLATQFLEHLDWYFQRPRFFLNHVLGG